MCVATDIPSPTVLFHSTVTSNVRESSYVPFPVLTALFIKWIWNQNVDAQNNMLTTTILCAILTSSVFWNKPKFKFPTVLTTLICFSLLCSFPFLKHSPHCPSPPPLPTLHCIQTKNLPTWYLGHIFYFTASDNCAQEASAYRSLFSTKLKASVIYNLLLTLSACYGFNEVLALTSFYLSPSFLTPGFYYWHNFTLGLLVWTG